MRAWFLSVRDGKTELELRDIPRPEVKPGQLLVKIQAASLNRGEFIAGHGLTKAGEPKRAGTDAAGEVVGTGQRIMGRCPGAFAEYALMDESDAIPVPPNLSWEEAAATPITFLVVHDMLLGQGGLKAGEWLLITGVSSGVGVAALQAGKALGAKVIGTSGSREKLDRLRELGLEHGLQTRNADFAKKVMELTDGKGVNLVVNNVGGSVFAECIRCMALQGRLATVGYLDGVLKAEMDIEALHSKRLKLFGVSNKHRTAAGRAETVRGFTADLLPHFAAGRIKPMVDQVFSFQDLPKAKAHMEADRHTGKIVIRL
ncbi:MAG TPA: zinc-binding dehydrogenase [Burkholderiales bacterium]|nr:zinc-binding dehydrogenase [Burkholderiales bacterium]